MAELVKFADDQLPADLRSQILSLHRAQWPDGYVGELQGRDWIQRSWFHPSHFALVEDGVVISYTGVVWKHLTHADEMYKTYGLSGVVTHPAFRRQGHGRRIVDAATDAIRRTDADIGLFTCAPEHQEFYAASGWLPMAGTVLFGGPRSAPYPSDERTMMGFFSEKGKRGRTAFASVPISFDDDLW